MLLEDRLRNVALSVVLMTLSACGGGAVAEPNGTDRVDSVASPLTTPPSDGRWHWYDVPGTRCLNGPAQNGLPSGIGISVPSGGGNGKLLIWMEAGGFCYDGATCQFPQISMSSFTASNFLGSCVPGATCNYTGSSVVPADVGKPVWSCAFSPALPNCGKAEAERGLWDRSPGTVNPFRNYTFVYIPYCTGDLHQGNHVVSSTLQFVGHQNFLLDAQSIHSTFPNPSAIVLGGRSAGGDGAVFNYRALRAVYTNPTMPVTVISDSAVPLWTGTPSSPVNPNAPWSRQGYWLRNPVASLVPSYIEDSFASAWGLAATVPPTVFPFNPPGSLNAIYPQQNIYIDAVGVNPLFDKFGVIVGSNDTLIAAYLKLQVNGSLPSVGEGIIDFATNVVLPHPNVRLLTVSSTVAWNPAFLPWNQHHTFLNDDVTLWGPQALGGSGALDFLTNPLQLGITP